MRISVCEVTEVTLHDRGKPRPNSLYDLRMGPSCNLCIPVFSFVVRLSWEDTFLV